LSLKLYKKNILFISPKFLGYEKIIYDYLCSLGANVKIYDERPSTNPFVKALIRINPTFLEILCKRYFLNIFNKNKKVEFDYIFIIKGEAMSLKTINIMKTIFPNTKIFFYTWDSLKNVKNSKEKIRLFDKALSFDRANCIEFSEIEYSPLFFSQAFMQNNKSNDKLTYDFIFIASLHSDRYEVLQRIMKNLNTNVGVVSSDIFLYYSSKLFFTLRKIFDTNFRNIPFKKVNWVPLQQNEVIDRMNRANIVIDINHPDQSGLTMRTIEALAMKKKIITTNNNIAYEDFYNEKNILIIDRYNPIIPKLFIEEPFENIDNKIYNQYKLESWIERIFNE
jgi:hypothetical protein